MYIDSVHLALGILAVLTLGAVAKKLLLDETLDCVEDLPWLIVKIAARILPAGERPDFLEYCRDDLLAMQEEKRHRLWHIGRSYWYAVMHLVRAPRRRIEARKAMPVVESLGSPPPWAVQVWKTMFMFHRGLAVPRNETAAHPRLAWIYRVHRIGNIDGPITVRSFGFGHSWHFTAITMPWPGRTGAVGHRPTIFAILHTGMPVIGLTKRRYPTQPGARISLRVQSPR